MDTDIIKRSETSIAERLVTLEIRFSSVIDMFQRIEDKVDSLDARIDHILARINESAVDRATISANQLAIKAELGKNQNELDGLKAKGWAILLTSISAVVAALWGFIKK